ncbi:MAG: NAD(P)H-hydrate epimerase [Pirellulales bacterium]
MAALTITCEQSRRLDQWAAERYSISTLVLMENAGRGVADVLSRLGISGPVVICCGKGNNGGDGFVVARQLDQRGYEVRIAVFGRPEELRGDAAANYAILERAALPIEIFAAGHERARLAKTLAGAAWVVDSLLGTGSRGAPRPPLDAVIEQLNAQPAPMLAVDIPSGLDCDTGEASPATIRAAHTCTFVAAKPGLLLPAARPYVGELHVVDLGIPRRLVKEILQS